MAQVANERKDTRTMPHEPDDQQKHDKNADSSAVEILVPIPDFFYDVRSTLPYIGSSHSVVRTLTNTLYLLTFGIFIATFTYYSLPGQLHFEERFVQADWFKSGFDCKPLQKIDLRGFKNDLSFSQCVSRIIPPDENSIVAVEKGGETHYDYVFISDEDTNKGVASVYDEVYPSSILQTEYDSDPMNYQQNRDYWKSDGRECYPEPPYSNTFNVPLNYSECIDMNIEPSSDTISLINGFSPDCANDWNCMQSNNQYYYSGPRYENVTYGSYRPFGSGTVEYPSYWNNYQSDPNNYNYYGNDLYQGLQSIYPSPGWTGSYYMNYPKLPSGEHTFVRYSSNMYGAQALRVLSYDQLDYDWGPGWQGLYSSIESIDEAISAWKAIVETPDQENYPFGKEGICNELKRNSNGFRCYDQPRPPRTPEEAIERYSSMFAPEKLCEPIKENSPFQCTRMVENSRVTRLSLSLASSQAFFAFVGILLVGVLRKMGKNKRGDSLKRVHAKEVRVLIERFLAQDKQYPDEETPHVEVPPAATEVTSTPKKQKEKQNKKNTSEDTMNNSDEA